MEKIQICIKTDKWVGYVSLDFIGIKTNPRRQLFKIYRPNVIFTDNNTVPFTKF